MTTRGAEVRAKLDHPLIDGDSHIIEYTPVFLDFLKEAGGQSVVDNFMQRRGRSWYQMSWDERRETRTPRGPWWALPTKNTLDRCTAMLPRLYYERMDDFGLDFTVLYPTVGLGFNAAQNDEFRAVACHAYNEFVAASYAQYADRMTCAALVPLHTPEEGIRELEHAKSLGLKVAMIPSFVRRPVPAVAREHPDMARRVTWLDSYGIDSEYDYDPFWAKCEELGIAVAAHSGGMGFDDRRTMSNYMYNHMGHFAAAGEVLAKALLMGGVTRRFPKLRVALLEGGAVNGTRLYADILARWKKRSPERVENMNPENVDLQKAHQLFEEYADEKTLAKLEQLDATLGVGRGTVSPELRNDFEAMQIERDEDLRDLFIPHFYFGCEADDPLAHVAFNRKANPFHEQVRAIMSFDLGHWDVTDMSDAAAEAYEQLEEGLIDEEDFRKFGFGFSVQLYAGPNPDFFKGTRIEAEASRELSAAA
ncbi:MAG: amidohydrolase family protein [Gammaproteobacteria bacterium]|jgi:predicted TIM-barrel fold metal-dependent hydrolase